MKFRAVSIHQIEPAQFNFPFVGCFTELDNYAIFSLKLPHTSYSDFQLDKAMSL